MLAKARKGLTRMAIGAVAGAVLMVLVGQLLGLFLESCTVVCRPDIAWRLGAIGGAFAALMVRGYEPG